jgi:FkbM family methyltransferase
LEVRVLEGFLSKAWHYAHALDVRLFQQIEWNALRKSGIPVTDALRKEIWQHPSESEDWINLARFLSPSESIFLIDVGANVGNFTARAMAVYPDLQAMCIEPAQANFTRLAKRFEGNRAVTLHQAAASDQPSTSRMYIGRSDSLFSLEKYTPEGDKAFNIRDGSYAATEEIVCETLDSIRMDPGQRTVLLKIDVQGHEEKALAGASKVLPMVDVAIIECSFANEYEGVPPSFAGVTQKLAAAGLYPIVFQDYGRRASSYAVERDVIFAREDRLKKIWYSSYGK